MIHENRLKPYHRSWDKMKLGAVWNFWDGEENLAESVEAIRAHVDFLALVWSAKSVYGEKRTPEDLIKIGKLCKSLKFDEVVRFEPIGTGQDGEAQKRNQAIDLCRIFECTHFISIDPDEIFQPEQFALVKSETIEYNYATTCAPIDFEIFEPKEKTIRMAEYMPMIYRLDGKRRFGKSQGFPVKANGARKLTTLGKSKDDLYRIYVSDEIIVKNRQGNRIDLAAYERSTRNSFYTQESNG